MVQLSVEYYDDVASVVVAVMYLIEPARLLHKYYIFFSNAEIMLDMLSLFKMIFRLNSPCTMYT